MINIPTFMEEYIIVRWFNATLFLPILYHANSDIDFKDPDLQGLMTLQVTNLMSTFSCLYRSKNPFKCEILCDVT
jgi:hypothetical protein